MKNFILLSLFVLGGAFSGQIQAQKKSFQSIQEILHAVHPHPSISSWAVVEITDQQTQEYFSSGKKLTYETPTEGFQLDGSDRSRYFFVYAKGNQIYYVTKPEQLRDFIGAVDNVHEAALTAISYGYIVDTNFKIIAANYEQDATHYILDIGKVTSETCPYKRTHFMVKIDKSTGFITHNEANFDYSVVYNKDCDNHPSKLIKKEEVKEEPKKTPPKKKRR